MEKQLKLKNRILKILPKASSITVTFQNQPFSPGRWDRQHHHNNHGVKGFSGPIMPMIPHEARSKPKGERNNTDYQEPTSPKISCMGQIKNKKKQHKKVKKAAASATTTKSTSKDIELKKKHVSKFQRMLFSARRKSSASLPHQDDNKNKDAVAVARAERAPHVSQMKKFASGRDAFANFDWKSHEQIMDDSTLDYQINQRKVDFEFESNEVPEPLSVVDEQLGPKVGMNFKTLEDAAKFYKDYAKAASFFTRVRSTNKKENEIKNQLITCSREEKWKSKISPTEKTNPTAGLNCPARIYIYTLKDVGAWIISKVMLHHSHPCCPTQIEMLKQHRELSMSDVRYYITREVRNVLEQEDVKKFGKYLLRMKEKNQNFFFELELEDDQSIKLAFWANARSRAAFEYFRDVISFDTTYNTNRYNLVCGSFVGVNHHGQSILLGCALIKNEAIESFKWLFQCWLRCMGGNAPKEFLTDQCASIKRAIEACMPTTIHRWCIWHITKKIPSKLNGYKGHAKIEQELSQVVWNSHSKDSFDRNWNDFLLILVLWTTSGSQIFMKTVICGFQSTWITTSRQG
ncbi:hypothetical protein Ahy_A08g037703 [Arachis hypogaea]|uniref:Uncharacterized protein n=1 Tax=Arachis hypogaea TaxID=3818 RepID=A0A445BRH9_ARAHY|nr:hypothetical protein Ahy_A08g037703 [Arachis hypogaea]